MDTTAPTHVDLVGVPSDPSASGNVLITVSASDAYEYRYNLREESNCDTASMSGPWYKMDSLISQELNTRPEISLLIYIKLQIMVKHGLK